MTTFDIVFETENPEVTAKALTWMLNNVGTVVSLTEWDKGDK